MSSNSWNQTLVVQQSDGSALTNTTSATSILLGAAKFTLPANLLQVGTKLRIKAGGKISTAASTPGTLTLDCRFGSVIVFNGGASGTLATSASNVTWDLEMDLICRAIGSGTSANIIGQGRLLTAALSTATPILLLPATSPAVGSGFDSTASQAVDLFATWSVASASNTITCNNYELVLLN